MQVAVKLAMMLCVHWAYGLATLIIMLLFYVYIGQAAPGGPPGIATEFVFLLWIKNKFLACIGYSVVLSAERKCKPEINLKNWPQGCCFTIVV